MEEDCWEIGSRFRRSETFSG
uniref:Uncharacterized protein n=1 Tax=Rhizophora mucronata TaxID=61149 RepID=A0A2P2KLC3_RHIMU